MVTVFVHRNGHTRCEPTLDPSVLAPDSDAKVWVDLAAPGDDELKILSDVFHFHPLAVEDAVAEVHHPKIESYNGYLYLILHGIDYQRSRAEESFLTHDTDFFLGSNYLVTVHDGKTRSIAGVQEVCGRSDHVLGEGAAALMHRIIDRMVDNYRPEIEQLEQWLDELEREVFDTPKKETVREILSVKHDVTALRRIATPQRDAVARLARREYPQLTDELTYRFRDVYDNLVRIADESLIFQDRITSLLDAHYSNISNRLNEIMRVLTVLTVIVAPLTLVAGIYGMNMHLPGINDPDNPRPFWWLMGGMATTVVLMLLFFRRRKWL
jgi:magnesium transporter